MEQTAVQRLAQLEGFMRQDPNNRALALELAMAALEAGEIEKVERVIEQDGLFSANEHEVVHLRALVALSRHQFDKAVDLLQDLLSQGVELASLRFNLGYALMRLGRLALALCEFEAALSGADSPKLAFSYLLRCRHHLGDLELAVELWENAAPGLKTADAAGVASLVFFDAGRAEDARVLAREALKGAPDSVEALVVVGSFALSDGDTAAADAAFRRALERSPADGRVWSSLAMARLLENNLEAAEVAFRRAVELSPSHLGTWLAFAWCFILRRDLQGAQSCLEAALGIDRSFGEIHGTLAVVEALQGRRSAAEAAIERADRLDRRGMSARYAEAILKGAASDAGAIESLAHRLLRSRPELHGAALLAQRHSRKTKLEP